MTILAETSTWGSIIENVLIVVHIVVCLLLCLVVLMQRPKQEGLGAAFGGGMTDQAFGARTTDVLQKGTVYLASILFIITLILSILVSSKSNAASIAKENEENVAAAVDENVDAANGALADADQPSAEDFADAVKKAIVDGENNEVEGTEGSEGTEVGEDKPAETPETEPAPESTEPAPAEETETPEQ